MTVIGFKEVRQNFTQIAERVQAGETFIVVKRSKPVLKISAANDIDNDQELRDWTKQAIERYRPALEKLSEQ